MSLQNSWWQFKSVHHLSMKKRIQIRFSGEKMFLAPVVYESLTAASKELGISRSALSEAANNDIEIVSKDIDEVKFLDNSVCRVSSNRRGIVCYDWDTGKEMSRHESIIRGVKFYKGTRQSSFAKCLSGYQKKMSYYRNSLRKWMRVEYI